MIQLAELTTKDGVVCTAVKCNLDNSKLVLRHFTDVQVVAPIQANRNADTSVFVLQLAIYDAISRLTEQNVQFDKVDIDALNFDVDDLYIYINVRQWVQEQHEWWTSSQYAGGHLWASTQIGTKPCMVLPDLD